jgi:hypothetical protein
LTSSASLPYAEVTIGDQERTAMRLMVEPRWPKKSPDAGGVSGTDD